MQGHVWTGGTVMYVKKSDGPRVIRLPSGRLLTRADLPEPPVERWVASRKASVVYAVRFGLLSEDEACGLYELSSQELADWGTQESAGGVNALKVTQARGRAFE